MNFIAVDLGSSFIKGAVLDIEALTIKHIQRVPFPERVSGLPSLMYEVDPQQVVAAFRQLVIQLLSHTPDCRGLVMCSQMHGLVLTTPQGEPRSNCITWQDQRALSGQPAATGSYFETISDRLSDHEKQQIGRELKPSLPLCNLYWLAQQGKLPDEEVIASSLPDFVLANLCRATPTIELTNAASHGAINLETLNWHQEIINKLGLTRLRWPKVHRFGDVVAEVELAGQKFPCYTPVGDHQCAITGAFLAEEELSINVATASQVTMLSPRLALGDYQTRPFFDGRFMNTIARLPAGRSLNVLLGLLHELSQANDIHLPEPWDYIAQAVEQVHKTSLTVDLSFFATTIGSEGSIGNIQEDNFTVGHLFRAAFQNMADNYLTSGLRLSPQQKWQRLVFSGGLAQRIGVLRDIIQQKFQIGYRLCASEEDALLGLLALAMVAAGRTQSVAAATSTLQTTLGYRKLCSTEAGTTSARTH